MAIAAAVSSFGVKQKIPALAEAYNFLINLLSRAHIAAAPACRLYTLQRPGTAIASRLARTSVCSAKINCEKRALSAEVRVRKHQTL